MQDRIEKTVELAAPIERVWQALTDHEQFGEWFKVKLDGPFVIGEVSRGQVTYPGYEYMAWEATVKTIEPLKRFEFSWCPYFPEPGEQPDYDTTRETLVRFELEPTATGTRLRVTESGFSKLPDDQHRLDALRMNTQGWDEQAKNIAAYVES